MKIGISIRINEVNNKETYILYKRYVDYFIEDEIILLLPNQSKEVLDLCDAFMLTGGDDLNPSLYNQENINSNNINDEIDKLDFNIIKHAYDNNKKLLGVCRGIQSINVYFKGTLKQDYKNHMNVEHKINQINKPRLFDIGNSFFVNSYHHQTIDKLGVNLIATYSSDDEIIEIIEHKYKAIIGVQYHPEISKDKYAFLLFELFKKL